MAEEEEEEEEDEEEETEEEANERIKIELGEKYYAEFDSISVLQVIDLITNQIWQTHNKKSDCISPCNFNLNVLGVSMLESAAPETTVRLGWQKQIERHFRHH